MSIQITIAICTYNRAQIIPRAIGSILQQDSLKIKEILIVDNNSSDNTKDVVKTYAANYPKIRYCLEKNKGISNVRNRAMNESKTDFLAFLDDDAWASPTWINSIVMPLQTKSLNKNIACVVGPVKLVWEGGGKPNWFPKQFESLLCEYNYGVNSHFLDQDGYLLTTNVLFHAATIKNLGGFRTDLGRLGNKPLGGEDNEIYQRLYKNGYKVWYQSDALVYHPVPVERQTREYLLNRLYWDGASQPLMNDIRDKPSLIRKTLYELRNVIKLFWKILFSREEKEFKLRLEIQQRKGKIATMTAIILGRLR